MQKVSENIILKSIDNSRLCCLQSKGDYDYREVLDLDNSGEIWCCIGTDKFLIIESEGLVDIKQDKTTVTLVTKEGEYRLPIMRERGIFISQPEVMLPAEDPIKIWDYDFSGKSINTKVITNTVNLASALVIIGENLVARSVNNLLEQYGDSSTATLSISPVQYALVQKLGKVRVKYYNSGEVAFVGEDREVRVKYSKPPLRIQDVEKNLTQNSSFGKIDISKLKLKILAKFTLDKVYLILKSGSFSIVTESARKTAEAPELKLQNQIILELLAGDLKYLVGEVSISEVEMRTKKLYVLRAEDKDKVTYLLVPPSYKDLSW